MRKIALPAGFVFRVPSSGALNVLMALRAGYAPAESLSAETRVRYGRELLAYGVDVGEALDVIEGNSTS